MSCAASERVGVALRALGVDVDQAHLDRGERVVELAVAGVALRAALVAAEPLGLRAPVDVVVRLPRVDATAGEAEGLEAHVLERDVAGEDHQVGPRERVAVLLLDRPQQAAGLVEVAVVGPRVERGEALLAGATAAAAVLDAVGAGAVPRHPDHQRAVVAEVRGPPVLAVVQHRGDVGLHGAEVEGLERGGVVEVRAERVQDRLVLREDPEVEPLGPPLAVGVTLGGVRQALVQHRALAGRGVLVHLADLGVGLVLVGGVDGGGWSRWAGRRRRRAWESLSVAVAVAVLVRGGRGGAGGAEAPVGDLGLVDDEAVGVGGVEAGAYADRAVDVGDRAARAAHHVVVVVADAQLVARDRAGGLDPADETGLGSARRARRRRPGARRPAPRCGRRRGGCRCRRAGDGGRRAGRRGAGG